MDILRYVKAHIVAKVKETAIVRKGQIVIRPHVILTMADFDYDSFSLSALEPICLCNLKEEHWSWFIRRLLMNNKDATGFMIFGSYQALNEEKVFVVVSDSINEDVIVSFHMDINGDLLEDIDYGYLFPFLKDRYYDFVNH